jgi:hypothetical protein
LRPGCAPVAAIVWHAPEIALCTRSLSIGNIKLRDIPYGRVSVRIGTLRFMPDMCLDWGLLWIQRVTSRMRIVTKMPLRRTNGNVPACSAGKSHRISCLPGPSRRASWCRSRARPPLRGPRIRTSVSSPPTIIPGQAWRCRPAGSSARSRGLRPSTGRAVPRGRVPPMIRTSVWTASCRDLSRRTRTSRPRNRQPTSSPTTAAGPGTNPFPRTVSWPRTTRSLTSSPGLASGPSPAPGPTPARRRCPPRAASRTAPGPRR